MTTHVGLVVNPTAGKHRGHALGQRLAAELHSAGIGFTDLSAETGIAAEGKARRAVAEGLDVLVVAGGDGMAHLGANVCAGTDTALAIAAAGTGNDIARALSLPIHDPVELARLVAQGHTARVDAIRQETRLADPRWFVGVLAGGFDAIVNERANRWAWPKGQMRYNLAVMRELPVFRPIPYRLVLDGAEREVSAMLVAVANAESYGGGMRVCPDADLADGLADVLIVHDIPVPQFLRVFPKVFTGTHVDHPAVEIVRARSVRLEAAGIVAYADGERFGPLPLDLRVEPGALTVIVP
ncbi:MAG: YegS/Rv2252/BmrU family lipid kinase [Micrococcales bacterium]|nr:YegS/Rv2252/BmrU family lipid kinase [Micrococcales bacterium]